MAYGITSDGFNRLANIYKTAGEWKGTYNNYDGVLTVTFGDTPYEYYAGDDNSSVTQMLRDFGIDEAEINRLLESEDLVSVTISNPRGIEKYQVNPERSVQLNMDRQEIKRLQFFNYYSNITNKFKKGMGIEASKVFDSDLLNPKTAHKWQYALIEYSDGTLVSAISTINSWNISETNELNNEFLDPGFN